MVAAMMARMNRKKKATIKLRILDDATKFPNSGVVSHQDYSNPTSRITVTWVTSLVYLVVESTTVRKHRLEHNSQAALQSQAGSIISAIKFYASVLDFHLTSC